MKKDGYITVYLALTMAILLSLIVTLIEGIRIQTIRFQTECVMDIGLNSIFAEYNRQALKQYGLLLLDTSYGYENPSDEKVKSKLLQYMNMNFDAPGKGNIAGYKDLTAIHADNANFSQVSYASDCKGSVLTYQIIQYMKEKNGMALLDQYCPDLDLVKDGEGIYEELENRRHENNGIIESIINMLNAQLQEGEDEISIDNPADYVDGMRSHSILDYVVSDVNQISRKGIDLSKYISHRKTEEGSGLWEEQESPDGFIDKRLYHRYLFEKCGYYQREKENSLLSYQLEYLLYGKNRDDKNLQKFAEGIFKIRYAINAAYLFSNPEKMMQAEELAAVVTSAIMHPELTEAVKISILFAWIYAESIQDVKIIFDGKKAARGKDDTSWNVPLSELLTFTAHLNEYHDVPDGTGYDDYLSAFLFIKNKEDVRMHFMDIMEMDIKKTTGNENFALDHCVYQLEAGVNVSSRYGYGCRITRRYSYE